MSRIRHSLFDPTLARRAALDAVRKLDPRHQWRNPVMFTVWAGSLFATGLGAAMHVTATFAMILRNGTFAGVVIKTAAFCTFIQCTNGIGRQSTKTHRGYIEHTGGIGFCTVWSDRDPKIM